MVRRRVLISEDDGVVVERFRRILEPHFAVASTAGNSDALLSTASVVKPDVVLLDIEMPCLNGVEPGRELKRSLPETKLILTATIGDSELAGNAMRQWASGYILKKSAGSELIKAVCEVVRGNWYVTPRLAQQLLDYFVRNPRSEPAAKLTSRQREVLQLLATGKNMREAADILHITRRTIAFHKYRIMEEYGLRTNSDLVVFAIREHLIRTEHVGR